MIDSFNKEVSITIPKMTDTDNPFYQGKGPYVPFDGLTSVLIQEDPRDKECRDMDRRLKEHQSIKWTKEYYKEDN